MRTRIPAALAAAVLLAATSGPADAQETYDACYVPEVGALYLIGLEGLPTECLAATHVQINWTEGGTAVVDHGELTGLADDDHPAYVREGEAAGGDLEGSFPDPAVGALQGWAVSPEEPMEGMVLTWNSTSTAWEPRAAAGGTSDHGALDGLADDDHPGYLLVNGVREANDGFAVTGGTGGSLLVEGPGRRLLWYPDKSAFRVGRINSTEWDDASIGVSSIAAGLSTTASGNFTVAMGNGTEATADYAVALGGATAARGVAATALGYGTTASGERATAMGSGTLASGQYATALGHNSLASQQAATAMGIETQASGAYATAMGWGTVASGTASTATGAETVANAFYATAMGYGTEASGQYATAMGQNTSASGMWATTMGYSTQASGEGATAMGTASVASGRGAMALGYQTTASGIMGTAFGYQTTASGDWSTTMGHTVTAQAYQSVALGRYNVVEGSPNTWIDTDPLLVAGNGDSTTPSNALTLYKDGNLTIAGTLTESSDARLKIGIEPLETVLDRVRDLTPVRFRFRHGTGHPTDPQIGLIAQEVAAAFPELVSTDGEGYLSLAYPKLTAVLIGAIHELEARNHDLEAETRRLADRLAALEAAVRSLRDGRATAGTGTR